MHSPFPALVLGLSLLVAVPGNLRSQIPADRVSVTLAATPALSPDGSHLAFSWAGDLWIAKARGGAARRLTTHAAYEGDPAFSPDGSRLAFTSSRSGKDQVYTMPVEGGLPRQLTFHSEGARVVEWYPDGASLLIEATRDFATRRATRFYRISAEERGPEVLLFDAEGHSPALSPDGKRLLFCREGSELYRRGYRGSQASQIWLAEDLETASPKFRQLVARESEARSPMWRPDGAGFYYLGDHGEAALFDLWERDLGSGEERRLTTLADDPAIGPAIARDGSAAVFRQRFEFRDLALAGKDAEAGPRPVRLEAAADTLPDPEVRRVLAKADNVSFSADGLEMAFAAGGDIWVMDTELREPVAVTRTAAEEREPILSPDGSTLYFIRDEGGSTDLWSVARADAKAYWWRNREFKETRLTEDGSAKEDLRAVPGGTRLSWIAGAGDLWVAERDGKGARRLVESWNAPHYDWSPDGRWIAYAVYDNDFNRDVWIAPTDGSAPPYNLSRHPDNDEHPSWSPDGRMLAFVGRRHEKESDIHYVHLRLADEEKDKRDRTLESALKKMDAARKKSQPAAPPKPSDPPKTDPPKTDPPKTDPPKLDEEPSGAAKKTEAAEAKAPAAPAAAAGSKVKVTIDFERLSERIHRVTIPDTDESGLFWSPDSKRLAFAASVKGVRGTYTVSFPDPATPALLFAKTGGLARWIAKDETVLWLVEGVPASLSKGALKSYPFTARQAYARSDYQRAGFRQIWRTIGDTWYDEALNHRDWEAVRAKYEDAAAAATDNRAFDRVVAMMLGELNGSHLGFRSHQDTYANRSGQGWSEETAHLGLVFDRFFEGPGWKVAQVVPQGPTDRAESRLRPGDVLLEIDGQTLEPDLDPTLVLNGPSGRELRIKVSRERKPEDGAAATAEAPAAEETMPEKAETPAATGDGQGGEEKQDDAAGDNAEAPSAETQPPAAKQPDAAPAKEPPAPPEPEILELSLRPVTYARAREQMKEARVEQRRELVERLGGGQVGYVLVEKMDWNEFVRFQEEIFARGHGKDGLIVDVRDNGGGFTADHLLTALTPVEHAVTVPRGGGPGYPQDRRVYATWNRPVVVLCNQNSFSNAEIFSHAIKETGRGKLVGVPTAGGVVSTGSTSIRDLGTLRVPFRGWFRKSDGADMERNGAVPDLLVWPEPADEAEGRDRQIERAVALLVEQIQAEKDDPKPEPRPASSPAQ